MKNKNSNSTHLDAVFSPKIPKLAELNEFQNNAPFSTIIKNLIDPIIIIGVLYLLSLYYDVKFDGYHIVLTTLTVLLSLNIINSSALFLPTKKSEFNDVFHFLISWCYVLIILFIIEVLSGFHPYYYHSYQITASIIIPFFILISHWIVAKFIVGKMAYEHENKKKIIIVGANQSGMLFREKVDLNKISNLQFCGYFDDRDIDRLPGVESAELKGRLNNIVEYAIEHEIEQIFISLPMASQPRVSRLLEELKNTTVSIFFIPDFFVFDLIQAKFNYVAGVPVICVCDTPLKGFSEISKRVTDILFATIILALIWPVMLIVALAVKMTSPGPILFKQNRYGIDGKSIGVYKFRSMNVMDNGNNVQQATRDDNRFTPIGAFIRKTSLDELPQFFNVLGGSMSIVGPRPHANAHNEYYRKLIEGYMIRHKVKPGITGWAQVNGFRGETETLEKMKQRVSYDLDYLREWSLWMDLKIILMTISLVLKRNNAY